MADAPSAPTPDPGDDDSQSTPDGGQEPEPVDTPEDDEGEADPTK